VNIGFGFVVVILVAGLVFFARHREPTQRARFLRRAGFSLMALFAVFFGLFLVGDTFTDPGGWKALGLVSLWAVPLAAVGAVAWYKPDLAIRLFAVLIAAVIGVSIWFALDPQGWRAFEDRNGPIRGIVVFALSAAIALLGLKRTAVAGAMLLILGVAPTVISGMGNHLGFVSMAVVGLPAFIAGVLYLLSAAMTRRSAPPGNTDAGIGERPLAA
jgi:hypothetical protein